MRCASNHGSAIKSQYAGLEQRGAFFAKKYSSCEFKRMGGYDMRLLSAAEIARFRAQVQRAIDPTTTTSVPATRRAVV